MGEVANVSEAKINPIEIPNPQIYENEDGRYKMFIKMTENGAWFVLRLPNCTKSGTTSNKIGIWRI